MFSSRNVALLPMHTAALTILSEVHAGSPPNISLEPDRLQCAPIGLWYYAGVHEAWASVAVRHRQLSFYCYAARGHS